MADLAYWEIYHMNQIEARKHSICAKSPLPGVNNLYSCPSMIGEDKANHPHLSLRHRLKSRATASSCPT